MNFGDLKNEVEPNDTDGDDVHISWEMSQAKATKIPLVPRTEDDGQYWPGDGSIKLLPGFN